MKNYTTKPFKYTPEFRQKLMDEWLANGRQARIIEDKYGLPHGTIFFWRKTYGYLLPKEDE